MLKFFFDSKVIAAFAAHRDAAGVIVEISQDNNGVMVVEAKLIDEAGTYIGNRVIGCPFPPRCIKLIDCLPFLIERFGVTTNVESVTE